MLMLPVNRVQLFKFTYRTNLILLIKLSLLLFFFVIPLLVVTMVRGGFEQIYWTETAGEKTVETLQFYFSQSIFLDLFYIPCFLVMGIGLSGAYSLMKAYTFGEGYIFKVNFFRGIRENGKEGALITLFFGVLYFLVSTSKNLISMWDFEYYTVMVIFEGVSGLVLLCAYVFALCQMVIYRNSFVRTVKNSLLFTFSVLPKIVGIVAITYLPFILCFSSSFGIVLGIVLFVYLGLGFGNAVLVTTLFCQSCFDKMINVKYYPEIYRKGLFDKGGDC